MFFLLYKRTDNGVFDDFPKISDHFPKISEDFPKLSQRPDERTTGTEAMLSTQTSSGR